MADTNINQPPVPDSSTIPGYGSGKGNSVAKDAKNLWQISGIGEAKGMDVYAMIIIWIIYIFQSYNAVYVCVCNYLPYYIPCKLLITLALPFTIFLWYFNYI